MDLLGKLEDHWKLLEAEVQQIEQDLEKLEEFSTRYGDHMFNSSKGYLNELKVQKKQHMREIIVTMDSFNQNVRGGKNLVENLERERQGAQPLLVSYVQRSETSGTMRNTTDKEPKRAPTTSVVLLSSGGRSRVIKPYVA
eukprot:TRINITY_DN7602_c0_g1_i1.p1 TRINITY_DN7602_c0_g1~~TRINITY_DN7602_c0_g1_i1.p1  ORF type:complete len:140 (+),score=32.77 TRINITY_DN7602_c0_g1_i1:76-495(+)